MLKQHLHQLITGFLVLGLVVDPRLVQADGSLPSPIHYSQSEFFIPQALSAAAIEERSPLNLSGHKQYWREVVALFQMPPLLTPAHAGASGGSFRFASPATEPFAPLAPVRAAIGRQFERITASTVLRQAVAITGSLVAMYFVADFAGSVLSSFAAVSEMNHLVAQHVGGSVVSSFWEPLQQSFFGLLGWSISFSGHVMIPLTSLLLASRGLYASLSQWVWARSIGYSLHTSFKTYESYVEQVQKSHKVTAWFLHMPVSVAQMMYGFAFLKSDRLWAILRTKTLPTNATRAERVFAASPSWAQPSLLPFFAAYGSVMDRLSLHVRRTLLGMLLGLAVGSVVSLIDPTHSVHSLNLIQHFNLLDPLAAMGVHNPLVTWLSQHPIGSAVVQMATIYGVVNTYLLAAAMRIKGQYQLFHKQNAFWPALRMAFREPVLLLNKEGDVIGKQSVWRAAWGDVPGIHTTSTEIEGFKFLTHPFEPVYTMTMLIEGQGPYAIMGASEEFLGLVTHPFGFDVGDIDAYLPGTHGLTQTQLNQVESLERASKEVEMQAGRLSMDLEMAIRAGGILPSDEATWIQGLLATEWQSAQKELNAITHLDSQRSAHGTAENNLRARLSELERLEKALQASASGRTLRLTPETVAALNTFEGELRDRQDQAEARVQDIYSHPTRQSLLSRIGKWANQWNVVNPEIHVEAAAPRPAAAGGGAPPGGGPPPKNLPVIVSAAAVVAASPLPVQQARTAVLLQTDPLSVDQRNTVLAQTEDVAQTAAVSGVPGAFSSFDLLRVLALSGVAMMPPAATDRPVAPVVQNSFTQFLREGLVNVNQTIDAQGKLSDAVDALSTAQARADRLVFSVFGNIEKGDPNGPRRLAEVGPHVKWTVGGLGPIKSHGDRQGAISGITADQKAADLRQQFTKRMVADYSRLSTAIFTIQTLKAAVQRAEDLAKEDAENREALENAASNHAAELARDLAGAERDGEEAISDMRQAMQVSPEALPLKISEEGQADPIHWDVVRSILSEGKVADAAALGTALGVATALDNVKAAEEVVRSTGEKMKPANWTFDVVALARSLKNPPDIMAFATPNFVVFDKPDGDAMKSFLVESRNSFLKQRYQRFSDLNTALQVRAMMRNSATAYRDQANSARHLAEDLGLSPAERQHYNLEAAQADIFAQKAEEQADVLESAVQSAVAAQQRNLVADAEAQVKKNGKTFSAEAATALRATAKAKSDELGLFFGNTSEKSDEASRRPSLAVSAVPEKSPEDLAAFAKTLATDVFASALLRAQDAAAQQEKSLLKPKGKRQKFMEPLIPLFKQLAKVSEQPINEKTDPSADELNPLSVAKRLELSAPTRATSISSYSAYVNGPTSNQIDAPTMKDRSTATGPTWTLAFPVVTRSLKDAQNNVNTANEALAKLQIADAKATDATNSEITKLHTDMLAQIRETLKLSRNEALAAAKKTEDREERSGYTYVAKQAETSIATLDVLVMQYQMGAPPPSDNPSVPGVDQMVANFRVVRAQHDLVQHPVKKWTISGTSLQGTKVSFNYATGLIDAWTTQPLWHGIQKIFRHHPAPTGEQVQAARDLEDNFIKTRAQIVDVFSAQAATQKAMEFYPKEIEARQNALDAAKAKEQDVAQKPESPLIEVSTVKAEVRQRQVELWDIQRQYAEARIAAKQAREEYDHLQALANYAPPAAALKPEQVAEEKAKASFSKMFGAFIKSGAPDPGQVDELLAKKRVEMNKRFPVPGTTGILVTMDPYSLNIFDGDVVNENGKMVPFYTVGGHTIFGYDAEGRNTKQNAFSKATLADLDAYVLAKEKARYSAVKQKNSDQTLARLATWNEKIAADMGAVLKKSPFSDLSDQKDADMLGADADARAAAAKRRSSGATAELPSDRPTVWTAADAAKVGTLIAQKRFPKAAPFKSKKIVVPPFNGWAGAHNFETVTNPRFAGGTINIGNWRLRQISLRRANKAKDTAQDELDALNLANQRKDRANEIAGRLHRAERLGVELGKAETELNRATAVLDLQKSHLSEGGFVPGDLAGDEGSVERYRLAGKRWLELRGDLDQTNEQLDLDLALLSPAEKEELGIKRIPTPKGETVTLPFTETDLAIRLLSRKISGSPSNPKALARIKEFVVANNIPASYISNLPTLANDVHLADESTNSLNALMENLQYAITYLTVRAAYKADFLKQPTPTVNEVLQAYSQDPSLRDLLLANVKHVRDLTPTTGSQWIKKGWFASQNEWRLWALKKGALTGNAETFIQTMSQLERLKMTDMINSLVFRNKESLFALLDLLTPVLNLQRVLDPKLSDAVVNSQLETALSIAGRTMSSITSSPSSLPVEERRQMVLTALKLTIDVLPGQLKARRVNVRWSDIATKVVAADRSLRTSIDPNKPWQKVMLEQTNLLFNRTFKVTLPDSLPFPMPAQKSGATTLARSIQLPDEPPPSAAARERPSLNKDFNRPITQPVFQASMPSDSPARVSLDRSVVTAARDVVYLLKDLRIQFAKSLDEARKQSQPAGPLPSAVWEKAYVARLAVQLSLNPNPESDLTRFLTAFKAAQAVAEPKKATSSVLSPTDEADMKGIQGSAIFETFRAKPWLPVEVLADAEPVVVAESPKQGFMVTAYRDAAGNYYESLWQMMSSKTGQVVRTELHYVVDPVSRQLVSVGEDILVKVYEDRASLDIVVGNHKNETLPSHEVTKGKPQLRERGNGLPADPAALPTAFLNKVPSTFGSQAIRATEIPVLAAGFSSPFSALVFLSLAFFLNPFQRRPLGFLGIIIWLRNLGFFSPAVRREPAFSA